MAFAELEPAPMPFTFSSAFRAKGIAGKGIVPPARTSCAREPDHLGAMADFDLAIIGGGINGAGIARDAAGRGLRVLLVEQNDLASGTSAASTKLIHGGLRYLERAAFGLVRKALTEREVLLHIAPHLIRPMRFVLPVNPSLRSERLLKLGLFIYDHLGGRKILPPTRTLDLASDPAGQALRPDFRTAFEYSDCWVDDARLVVLNVLDAAEHGATIRTRMSMRNVERGDIWRFTLDDGGRRAAMSARILVNAAGPWVGQVAEHMLQMPGRPPVRLVKGSHIMVRKLFEHDRGYILQNTDRRVVFALPYERDFTLIGTTDAEFSGEPAGATPSSDEIDYLCRAANQYFRAQIGPKQVLGYFAGVRALYDDGSGKAEDITRDYHLTLDEHARAAPLLTVYGGKITTYRRLAEAALDRLGHSLRDTPHWTAHATLPGGDFAHDGVDAMIAQARARWPFLSEPSARRLVRAYGTRIERVLGAAKSPEQLGPRLGADLTAAEVRYLMQYEWARTTDDVLWRRSKLGLRLSKAERDAVGAFMTGDVARAAS
jgi:glycerol-3-phosphate dehydrogenase